MLFGVFNLEDKAGSLTLASHFDDNEKALSAEAGYEIPADERFLFNDPKASRGSDIRSMKLAEMIGRTGYQHNFGEHVARRRSNRWRRRRRRLGSMSTPFNHKKSRRIQEFTQECIDFAKLQKLNCNEAKEKEIKSAKTREFLL